MMQKITELQETRYRTVREKDLNGNRISKQVSYTGYREVNVVSGGKRFAHAFIDGIVYYVIYFFVEWIWLHTSFVQQNSIFAVLSSFVIAMAFMFLFPIYYILFEHFFQKTPGKFLTKAIVIDVYGNRPEIGTNILRNIIRLVPFEIFSCLNKRGWHDRWSDTYVVSEEEYAKIKELQYKAVEDFPETVDGNELKAVNSKLAKGIILYGLVPICIILYITILFKTCTGNHDSFLSLKNINHQKGSNSETDEIEDIANIYDHGQIDEAQERLLEFTSKHKGYYLAWTFLGHTYLDQGNYEKAIEAYKEGIKVNKTNFAPYNGLGMTYMKQEEYEKAMRELRIADSLEPNNSAVIGNLASLYDDMGEAKKAVEFGIRSVFLDSTNATLYANLAIYYYKDNQIKECNKMFVKAAKLNYEDMPELCDQIFPDEITEGYLTVMGNISDTYTEAPIEDVKIEVLNKDSLLIRMLFTDAEGNYLFALPIEVSDNYLVKLSYPKYIHKYFKVSTEYIPSSEWESKAMNIITEISLSEKQRGVDYSFLDKPLSRYFYNTSIGKFDYDKKLLDESLKLLEDMKRKEKQLLPRK